MALFLPLLLLLWAWPGVSFAEEATGILIITSSQPGATVFVDGQELGNTPLTRVLAAGSHQVRIVADDFDPYVRRVTVDQDITTRMNADLIPGNGTVEFLIHPSGATVLVDDREVGPTPIRIREVTPGSHDYRVFLDGYESLEGTFSFEEGKNILINGELRSSEGLFLVESNPSGAVVYFDGWEAGLSPLEMDDIPPGVHHVRLSLDGYADAFRTVDTTDGSKGEVHVRLSQRGTRLTIRTDQPDATVLVSGNMIGIGSRVKLPAMERGMHQIRVEAPGCKTVQRSVAIPARGRLKVRVNLARADSTRQSKLVVLEPFYRRWTFWAIAGGSVAGGAVAGTAIALALAPEPPPEGDVTVTLP